MDILKEALSFFVWLFDFAKTKIQQNPKIPPKNQANKKKHSILSTFLILLNVIFGKY